MSEQPGRYQRSAAGMVGAMIVLLAVVIGFVVVRDLNRNDPADPVRAVDYQRDAEFARQEAGFDLLAPSSLPDGWIATSARYVPGAEERWHLGLLTAEERYVGVEQADDSVEDMVEQHVDAAATQGEPTTVEGRRWSTWTDDGGDLALVREDGGTTTLVVGHDVPADELEAFVASLR